MTTTTVNKLRKKFKKNKKNFSDDFSLRIYRTLSWLDKSDELMKDKDYDLAFITLWVGFNAAYAEELPFNRSQNLSDRDSFKRFIKKVYEFDEKSRLYGLIWTRYPQSIRNLLNNQYAYTPFWQYQNGTYGEQVWQEDFKKEKNTALRYLSSEKGADKLMIIVFGRLYTIRNQIVHGGATYASSVNRKQVCDACYILGDFLPLMVDIMINHPNEDWGKPFYPPVDDASFE